MNIKQSLYSKRLSEEDRAFITNYEPRVRLVQVDSMLDMDRNGYMCTIAFYVLNYPEPVFVENFLERLR